MGQARTQRRQAQQNRAREKAATLRARQHSAERRRRLLIAVGSIVGVLAVIGGVVAAATVTGGHTTNAATGDAAAPAQVVADVTGVPAAVLDQVGAAGAGSTYRLPQPLHGATPLTAGGKPEIFYDGALFCPYCAAERWPMIIALSRFGAFTGLRASRSSSTDVYPDTPTFSFIGSHYASPYLTFTPVEDRDRAGKPLQTLTPAQQKLLATYDGPPYVAQGGIPFVYFAGKYLQVSASYDPAVLHGKTMSQIATALHDPTSSIAQAVDGAANGLTATLCSVTGDKPAAVCDTPAINQLQARLGH